MYSEGEVLLHIECKVGLVGKYSGTTTQFDIC